MHIRATVEIMPDKAGLRLEDGRLIDWPHDLLPPDAAAGMVLEIHLANSQGNPGDNELARDILNEVLNLGARA
jgi:hypothetical protein